MCNKLNNKARCNNSIKSATFSVKQNASSNSNNNTPRGDRSYRGRDLRRGGRGSGGGGGGGSGDNNC
jgi:hypothetical protein